jgi:hypothetical protein
MSGEIFFGIFFISVEEIDEYIGAEFDGNIKNIHLISILSVYEHRGMQKLLFQC